MIITLILTIRGSSSDFVVLEQAFTGPIAPALEPRFARPLRHEGKFGVREAQALDLGRSGRVAARPAPLPAQIFSECLEAFIFFWGRANPAITARRDVGDRTPLRGL